MFEKELTEKRIELSNLLRDYQNELCNLDEDDPLQSLILDQIKKIKNELNDIDAELTL